MLDRARLFQQEVESSRFQQHLRPIGSERQYLNLPDLSVDMQFGRANETSLEECLQVTILYHGHPGYTARFISHAEELELVEMKEVFGGRRGKSIHVGIKSPEVIRDAIMPIITSGDAPWQRLTMGQVIDVGGVAEMSSGAQQRMIANLPKIFGMELVGQRFVRNLK